MALVRPSHILVMDASVLINFLRVDRVDILKGCRSEILLTQHVADEVSEFYPEQKTRFEQAIRDGDLAMIGAPTDAENNAFNQLIQEGRLGIGECSAIAHAITHERALAMDDRQANTAARALKPEIQILKTEDIVVLAIQHQAITLEDADMIKADWELNHRFRLKFASFGERI